MLSWVINLETFKSHYEVVM